MQRTVFRPFLLTKHTGFDTIKSCLDGPINYKKGLNYAVLNETWPFIVDHTLYCACRLKALFFRKSNDNVSAENVFLILIHVNLRCNIEVFVSGNQMWTNCTFFTHNENYHARVHAYNCHDFYAWHLETCNNIIWYPFWVFQVRDQMMAGMASIYDIPHYQSIGYLCKTNIPSSTAMRGFGLPQAHFVIQTIMFDIAKHLNMSFNKVRNPLGPYLIRKFIWLPDFFWRAKTLMP